VYRNGKETVVLLRFEVSNHRSISEPVELSMIAVDKDRPSARPFELINERVLTVAGIYGPNASGKSNVVDALAWLSAAVAGSLRSWDEFIPREPFKFGGGPELPSTYEVDMVVGGVRYTYRLTLNDKEVVHEALYSYPERRRRSLFERDGLDIQLRRGLGALSGTRELLTPTTLALSAAVRFDEPEVRSFGRALESIETLGAVGGHRRESDLLWFVRRHQMRTEQMFIDSYDNSQMPLPDLEAPERFGRPESALALLRFADLGIDDVEVVEEEAEVEPGARKRLRLVHRVGGQQIPFSLMDESAGTRTWFRLIGPVLHTLRYGKTLLFDEIDASLHPRLSARLLELFQDPETNPNNAQLIFTSHDTSLLNHLNRDEVWLTEKGADGATTLTALAEYGGDKVRRSLNLEKAYLQGRFGAVPELDQQMLRQALGLVARES
jgi:uncharacterized protein